MKKEIAIQLKALPQKPGIYIYKDNSGNVIYVGKAKNLKKRVSSYFQKKRSIPPDKLVMISKIKNVEHIITDNEAEALLLEANLIKKHQPRYNIVLRDDKNYLYIKLNLKDEWPRVELVRRPKPDKINKYFGPYTSADSTRQTYKLIARIFKVRTCKKRFTLNRTSKAPCLPAGRSSDSEPCLKYHLGWCICPAETKISNSSYRKIFDKVAKFLKGQTTAVIRELKAEMKKASNQKKYEDAARIRDQIQAIEKVTAHQKIICLKKENYDVISLARQSNNTVPPCPPAPSEVEGRGGEGGVGDLTAINLFIIREGKLINKLNFILEHIQTSTDSEIIEAFLNQYYSSIIDIPKEIIIPNKIKLSTISHQQLTITSPSRGKKRQLLLLGAQNATDYLNQQFNNLTIQQFNNKKVLNDLKRTLHLPIIPARIECYDISNIQGANATGSMVVFTNGSPDKSQYRKFAINPRIYSGDANDVAMMAEVVSRRLKNIDWPKPDLILLDGGKPQLNKILSILSTINYKLSAIALAKRQEEIYIPQRKQPIILPRNFEVLKLLQRVRDEAHRFAKSYYLKRQQKESIRSILDDIPGIGPKTKKKLLQKFGSVEKIKKASPNKLAKVVNKKIAQKLSEYL